MKRRNTIQRDLVLDAVRRLGNHATADEIYAFISQTHPSIGKGTVYRNLNNLVEDKLINVVHLPDGADRFDHIVDDHCHVKCIKCGKLFDVDVENNTDLKDKITDSHGIKILNYNILFSGICSECQKKDR